MHFDIMLKSDITYDKSFSYTLAFLPAPVWIKGDVHISQYGNKPNYLLGEAKRFIESENIGHYLYSQNPKAIIRIDSIGHGTIKDLKNLIFDFKRDGFKVLVENLNE